MHRTKKTESACPRLLLAGALVVLTALAWAAAPKVTATAVGPHGNAPALVLDGKFPEEGSGWMEDGCVYWEGDTATTVVVDLGELRLVEDVVLQVDNNDSYLVEWSAGGESCAELFTVLLDYGEIDGGMDTFSTVKGDGEYEARIDFKPVTARYIRLKAVDGDDMYSVSEIKVVSKDPPKK
jgi:hypothetical protein